MKIQLNSIIHNADLLSRASRFSVKRDFFMLICGLETHTEVTVGLYRKVHAYSSLNIHLSMGKMNRI